MQHTDLENDLPNIVKPRLSTLEFCLHHKASKIIMLQRSENHASE